MVEFKRCTAGMTQGLAEKIDMLPTAGTQGPGFMDNARATQTLGRHQDVETRAKRARNPSALVDEMGLPVHGRYLNVPTRASQSLGWHLGEIIAVRAPPPLPPPVRTCHIAIMTTGENARGEPFDRAAHRKHRCRAARRLDDHDFLLREVAARLADRLDDVKRDFAMVLDLGCHGGEIGPLIAGRRGLSTLVQCDLSPAMAARARDANGASAHVLAADEERIPFADATFDLVLSNLSLHWVNDLPGTLVQIRRILKPDGLFLGAMLGGDTLHELRGALMEAELACEGGASPRISPFAGVRDAGNLLQRAGFALPVADCDTITVSYQGALALMRELRGMGESNATRHRRRGFSRRETLMQAAAAYDHHHAAKDGRIPATFEVIYLGAWAPHPCQPKPLAPGSASHRLAEALGAPEQPVDD